MPSETAVEMGLFLQTLMSGIPEWQGETKLLCPLCSKRRMPSQRMRVRSPARLSVARLVTAT